MRYNTAMKRGDGWIACDRYRRQVGASVIHVKYGHIRHGEWLVWTQKYNYVSGVLDSYSPITFTNERQARQACRAIAAAWNGV